MKPPLYLQKPEYDYEHRIGFRLIIAAGWLTDGAKTFLRSEHRMSFPNWRVLVVIGSRGPISAKDVSQRTSQPPDRITRTVDFFEQRGWVGRKTDPEDRRRVMLTMTPKGRKLYDHIEAVVREANHQMLIALTKREREEFDRILRKYEARGRALLETPGAWRRFMRAVSKKKG